MPRDVPLRCACGALHATFRDLHPGAGSHVVCYCDDCQAFAHFLGRAEEMLDDSGGTAIFQTSPARLRIERGTLEAVRLTPRGVLRWSAACCRSPVGNTLAVGALPFVGLIVRGLDAEAPDLGPVRAYVQTRFATGPVAGRPASEGAPVVHNLALVGRVARRRWRGDHRRSPFFDPETLAPVAEPHALDDDARRALYGSLASRS